MGAGAQTSTLGRSDATWQARAIKQMDAEHAELAADPIRAKATRRAAKICQCKSIALGNIEDAIATQHANTIKDIRRLTTASGGCGACAIRIEDILAELAPANTNAPALRQAAE